MIIYIFGFTEEDAGKTTIGLHIIRYLREIGLDVVPFKPIAGFNYWRQYENFINSVNYGIIFSMDAYRLEKRANSGERLEIINPVSFLFAPADIRKYIENNAVSRFLFEETLVRNLILARLTICRDKDFENHIYLNKRRVEYLLHDSRVLNILHNKQNTEIDITDLEKFISDVNVSAKLYIDSCFQKLLKNHKIILIESFNNSTLPWKKLLEEKIDIVIGAFPGYALFFDSTSFKDALKTLISFKGLEVTGDSILSVLNPKKVIRIPSITAIPSDYEKDLLTRFYSYFDAEIKNLI